MVQTFTLRGINIGVRKTFAALAKVFRKVFQSLSLRSPKSLAWYPKDFGMANVIPYSTIYYTIEHRTINHIARKFITDKGNKIPSRCSFTYIGRDFNLYHEEIPTASGWGNNR
ncbi:MAG: hypothetical protein IKT84_05855 [Bacteroidales bacterium]|nr:hypothetical protein [Bacteroidales bacterium]